MANDVYVVKQVHTKRSAQLQMMVVRGRQAAERLAQKWNLSEGDCCEISNVFTGERCLKKYISTHRT